MSPAVGPGKGPSRMNRNVLLAFIFWFLSGSSAGLTIGPAMTAYIYFVTNGSTMHVGIAEAIRGVLSVVAGMPAAVVADRTSRSTVLRIAALVFGLAVVSTTIAVSGCSWDVGVCTQTVRFDVLCVALGLWGAASGTAYSALEALFADSVPNGHRSAIYATKWQISIASRGIGPAVAALLFYIFGDSWRESEMRIVILSGAGLAVVAAGLLLLFRDGAALGIESDAHTRLDGGKRGGKQVGLSAGSTEEKTPLLESGGAINSTAEDEDADDEARDAKRIKLIPVLIASGDVISGLASGMTVKFFSIFFIDAVSLRPIAVSLIWAASPFATATFVSIARRLANRFGRIQLYLIFKAVGISLLVLMALGRQFWSAPAVIIPVYILRCALMNSPKFLTKTIMMDYVPKANRGKWVSFDLVFAVGWSGSAALGGYLVRNLGWSFTFLITASMQGAALIPYVVLLTIVPKHESGHASSKGV